MKHAIALLATGNELIQGEILNRDGQYIAQQLSDHGIALGDHMVVPDEVDIIKRSLTYLFKHFDTVITTGGLGPTSDDLTRNAIAEVMACPLTFNEDNWQTITKRITGLGLTIHPSNKQQAYFPQGATIYPNPHGTAAGCTLTVNKKTIVMLPGPRNECFPMFDNYVLPQVLKSHSPKKKMLLYRWRLFGVSEGHMAATLDEAIKDYPCEMGYRIHFPYLDVKMLLEDTPDHQPAKTIMDQVTQPYVICTPEATASQALVTYLENADQTLSIVDHATGGLLQATLTTPKTQQKIIWSDNNTAEHHFEINGLTEYWRGDPPHDQVDVIIQYTHQNQTQTHEHKLPYRSLKICSYAVEYICGVISIVLQNAKLGMPSASHL